MVLNSQSLMRNEEDLHDSSNHEQSAGDESLIKNPTPARSQISDRVVDTSMYSQSGKRSIRSSKYCGKKKTRENKRNSKFTKTHMHEKLAKCFYLQN